MQLLATRVLPLALHQLRYRPSAVSLNQTSIKSQVLESHIRVYIDGAWNSTNLKPVRDVFTQIEQKNCDVVLDMLRTKSIDSAFIGLLLLLEQSLTARGLSLRLTGTSNVVGRYLRLSGASHIVSL
jgi:anti-anti-sigma factor